MSETLEYKVAFGTAFSTDGFDFTGKGKIQIEQDKVIYIGKKRWPFLAQLAVFIVLTFVLQIVGILIALIIISFFCVSKGTLLIEKSTISDVKRIGQVIRFQGKNIESGKTKKALFKVESEEQAIEVENILLNA